MSFRDKMAQSIVVYLDSLTQYNKQEIALNIYMNFIQKYFQELLDKTKRLLILNELSQNKRIQMKKIC